MITLIHCLCNIHGDHGDCDATCSLSYGCIWPARPVVPTLEQVATWEAAVTCSALHPTEVRAYALIAASQLQSPSPRWHRDDMTRWEGTVLRTADRFAHYITTARHHPPTEESEDS